MSKMFAERLREARETKRKTQQEIAEYLGISAVSYGAWERGRAEPSLDRLVKLCRYFGATSDWLIGLDCERKPLVEERMSALKAEADRAIAIAERISHQIRDMEKVV